MNRRIDKLPCRPTDFKEQNIFWNSDVPSVTDCAFNGDKIPPEAINQTNNISKACNYLPVETWVGQLLRIRDNLNLDTRYRVRNRRESRHETRHSTAKSADQVKTKRFYWQLAYVAAASCASCRRGEPLAEPRPLSSRSRLQKAPISAGIFQDT